MEKIGLSCNEVCFSYPIFKSFQEGSDYISRIDPYYVKYFLVDENELKLGR